MQVGNKNAYVGQNKDVSFKFAVWNRTAPS